MVKVCFSFQVGTQDLKAKLPILGVASGLCVCPLPLWLDQDIHGSSVLGSPSLCSYQQLLQDLNQLLTTALRQPGRVFISLLFQGWLFLDLMLDPGSACAYSLQETWSLNLLQKTVLQWGASLTSPRKNLLWNRGKVRL